MSEDAIKAIADNADMIIAGYSYTLTENGMIRHYHWLRHIILGTRNLWR